MKPAQILAHNILQVTLGETENGPVVQLSTLAEINQLQSFNLFLGRFWQLINNGNLPTPPRDILPELTAEWRTVKAVLAHIAYAATPHAPAAFAESLFSPNLWLGQSYYRIRRLCNADVPKAATIQAAICYVAFLEAQAVSAALDIAASSLDSPITLNPEILDRETAEGSHETY